MLLAGRDGASASVTGRNLCSTENLRASYAASLSTRRISGIRQKRLNHPLDDVEAAGTDGYVCIR
jgi:hypothetical protein